MQPIKRKIQKVINTNQLAISEGVLALVQQALTHSSYAHEHNIASNERLEFLGDAVISLACIDYLYEKYPDYDEGILTQKKSTLVNGNQLAEIGQYLHLDSQIKLGAGETLSRKTLGRAVEAVAGALFLLDGYVATKQQLYPIFDLVESGDIPQAMFNYKGELQKYTQRVYRQDPEYKILHVSGSDHERNYTVKVTIQGSIVSGCGAGSSIKNAEQAAAKDAIVYLEKRGSVVL